MAQFQQDDRAIKIVNIFARNLNRFELVLVLLFIIAIGLRISTNLATDLFINIILLTLSALYFFNGQVPSENEKVDELEVLLNKIVSWACTVSSVGILFRITQWQGADILTILGSFTLIISIVVIVLNKSKKPELKFFSARWIIRILVILILGLSLMFAPTDSLKKIGLLKIDETSQTK